LQIFNIEVKEQNFACFLGANNSFIWWCNIIIITLVEKDFLVVIVESIVALIATAAVVAILLNWPYVTFDTIAACMTFVTNWGFADLLTAGRVDNLVTVYIYWAFINIFTKCNTNFTYCWTSV